MIGTLDVMANQVLLEATIAEITLNDDLKLGCAGICKVRSRRSRSATQ